MTYQKLSLCLFFLGLSGLIVSCAYFSKSASVQSAIGPTGKPTTAGRVAVPFFIVEKYRGGQGSTSWPDSAITDRFVTGLVKNGYKVIDRAQVRKILKENDMTPKDLHRDDNVQKVGALLQADTVVLGKLTLIELEDGKTLERKLNVRAISVLDGVVVFSVSSIDTTPYRVLSPENLADQAILDMFPPPVEGRKGKSKDKEDVSESKEVSASVKVDAEAEMSGEIPTDEEGDTPSSGSDEIEGDEGAIEEATSDEEMSTDEGDKVIDNEETPEQ